MTTVEDVWNESLVAIGRTERIGSRWEGSRASKIFLDIYDPALRALLRSAHWNMARKQAPMALLADATGQTPAVGTLVQSPWIYEYQWPIDAIKARFVPWNTQQNQNLVPQFSGSFPLVQGPPLPGTVNVPNLNVVNPFNTRLVPARFLVTLDYNYPAVAGSITDPSQMPDITDVAGVGPQQRTVVLTNVQNASLVYTALVTYPDEWESLFHQAIVHLLAAQAALAIWQEDRKFGLAMRTQAIASAKDAIMQARVVDGNEAWTSVDHYPDWMRARNAGASWNANFGIGPGVDGGPGVLIYGFDSIGFGDGGSAF